MPTSKQARARQRRQMDKVAVSRLQRDHKKRRNRILAAVIVSLLVIGLVVSAFAAANSGDDSIGTAPTVPTTTPKARQCKNLADKAPAGAPAFPNVAGPAPTKLVTKDLKTGTGAVVTKTSTAKIDYLGINCDGKIFDTSYGKQPYDADMKGGVIEGWLQGIPGMKAGGVRLLRIPPELAYGDKAQGELIPANEPLFFVVQVQSVA